jgi:TolB-like protein
MGVAPADSSGVCWRRACFGKHVNDLVERLLRRKLVQWAVAYIAGAWALLQGLDFLAGQFDWPGNVVRVFTVLLAIGLLAVLVVAWYHGERGAQRVSSVEVMMLAGIFALAGIGLTFVLRGRSSSPDAGTDSNQVKASIAVRTDPNSIAVLPFTNLSANPENEYFSDGITEEILNALAKIPGLQVASRTSSFSFKGQSKPLPEIASALNVAHVLEGSVRRERDRVRITAQLIDPRSDRHLWSEEFDRDLKDVFAVQSEIAAAIATELKLRLGERPLVTQATASTRAHDLYLQGLAEWNARRPANLRRAVDYFNQAVRVDSSYAQAWAGLALTYSVQPNNDFTVTYPTIRSQLRAAAQNALALDSTLAETHAALGFSLFRFEWQHQEGERELRRAVELNPNYSPGYYFLAQVLALNGRGPEALAASQRSLLLDPLSVTGNTVHGVVLSLQHRYEEARAAFRKALTLEPALATAFHGMARTFLAQAQYDSAAVAWGRFAELGTTLNPDSVRSLVRGLGSPNRAELRRLLLRWSDQGRALNTQLANLAAVANDRETAITLLERAFQKHDSYLVYLSRDPTYDGIRDDPRFAAMLRRLNYQ